MAAKAKTPSQGGHMGNIKGIAALAASSEQRATLGTPSHLAEAGQMAAEAEARQKSGKVSTPTKRSRSQTIIDRANGIGNSDRTLKASAIGRTGTPTSMSDIRGNRSGYQAAMTDHFAAGVYHPEK